MICMIVWISYSNSYRYFCVTIITSIKLYYGMAISSLNQLYAHNGSETHVKSMPSCEWSTYTVHIVPPLAGDNTNSGRH